MAEHFCCGIQIMLLLYLYKPSWERCHAFPFSVLLFVVLDVCFHLKKCIASHIFFNLLTWSNVTSLIQQSATVPTHACSSAQSADFCFCFLHFIRFVSMVKLFASHWPKCLKLLSIFTDIQKSSRKLCVLSSFSMKCHWSLNKVAYTKIQISVVYCLTLSTNIIEPQNSNQCSAG